MTTEPELTAALTALRAVARRSVIARGLQGPMEQRLLQSIVDATASLFDAEASSIALFERDPDRLEFRVASGAHGAGAIGLTVKPSQGIAGFVFSTAQAVSLSDVGSDPRFDHETAERTGYVPRSVAAVPLLDEEGTIGVLQVLDKRGEESFSLRDMELLAVFAAQASTALTATRVQAGTAKLLAAILHQLADEDLTAEQVEVLVSDATRGLDDHADTPFWHLVDHVEALRTLGERDLTLVADILNVVARHAERAPRRR
ncbi:MAG TPA: GAF domain-containing protein [Candidatus Limnocylindrales bacterium]|nr:GAF domain-containing protein [Candidatus Limnocylindrales bacterium]